MKTAQIHRFGDCVAMYLSNGETVYMTPQDGCEFKVKRGAV